MKPRKILLIGEQQRQTALTAIAALPVGAGIEVVIREGRTSKTREQEERYHAMLGDVAKQCRHLNVALGLETWKRLAIDQFKRDTLTDPECCANYWARNQLNVIPSLDGSAIVVLGEQSRHFPVAVASVFIEWLYAFGAERGVSWSDPTIVPFSAYDDC